MLAEKRALHRNSILFGHLFDDKCDFATKYTQMI